MRKRTAALVAIVLLAGALLLAGSAQGQQRMTVPMAKYYLGKALTDDWGQQWKSRDATKWKNCHNVSSIRVSCFLAWRTGNYIYFGKVLAYFRPNDKRYVYTQTQRIRRQRA